MSKTHLHSCARRPPSYEDAGTVNTSASWKLGGGEGFFIFFALSVSLCFVCVKVPIRQNRHERFVPGFFHILKVRRVCALVRKLSQSICQDMDIVKGSSHLFMPNISLILHGQSRKKGEQPLVLFCGATRWQGETEDIPSWRHRYKDNLPSLPPPLLRLLVLSKSTSVLLSPRFSFELSFKASHGGEKSLFSRHIVSIYTLHFSVKFNWLGYVDVASWRGEAWARKGGQFKCIKEDETILLPSSLWQT